MPSVFASARAAVKHNMNTAFLPPAPISPTRVHGRGTRLCIPRVHRASRVSMTATQPVKVEPEQNVEGATLGDAQALPSVDYLELVLTSRVYDIMSETALEEAPLLSTKLGNRLMLKREDTTDVKSFKLRGAYNMMAKAARADLRRGVVAASAGNHAQGVALAAERLGVSATIVMPAVTPKIKVDAVKRRGAEAILFGDNFDEAKAHALGIAEANAALFVPPFDHPDVIAGQGTVGLELLRQSNSFDAVFVPVGGGGLIAGIATVIKRLRPHVRIIGVEPRDADAMYRSLAADRRVRLDAVGTFADGVAVVEVGVETFRICRDLVDEVVLVDTDEICAAIKDVFEDTRSILEPAGALGVAGAKAYAARRGDAHRDESYIAITSGANTNFDRLRHVSERTEIGEGREALLAVIIPEAPGAFRALMAALGNDVNITEFNYRYREGGEAHVFVGASVESRGGARHLLTRLRKAGYAAHDLSDNEMAKLHVRHLVGGRPPKRRDESVYRFLFPERPGALNRFLRSIPDGLDISMFHYRNHGADVGRVFCGLVAVDGDRARVEHFVQNLGYRYTCEDDNIAYKFFLSGQ